MQYNGLSVIFQNLHFSISLVYEVVRHFGRVLRISPFGFEDFCAAIISDEQPCIIAEIHVSIMR